MARGINKVILVGNLGRDPEIRYTPSGAAVANVTIATSDQWKDKQTGENQERTEWHRVVFFNRLAEIVGEYLKKGSQIYVEGRLQTRKWQDQSGQDRYTTEIVANEMQMLGSRGGGGGDYAASAGGFAGGAAAGASAGSGQFGGETAPAPGGQAPAGQGGGQDQAAAPSAYDDFDDDIPF